MMSEAPEPLVERAVSPTFRIIMVVFSEPTGMFQWSAPEMRGHSSMGL